MFNYNDFNPNLQEVGQFSFFWPSPEDHMQVWDCTFGGDFHAGTVSSHQPIDKKSKKRAIKRKGTKHPGD
jgi:hypothetical protein